jgi:uncharacterized protein YjiK
MKMKIPNILWWCIPVLIIAVGTILFNDVKLSHGLDDAIHPVTTLTVSFLREPSGITFHPLRKTLFVVGDEGDIAEILPDGTLIALQHIADADFEGITCHLITGLLYIAIEGEECILEVAPDDFAVLRTFSIRRDFQKKQLLIPGGNGLEAITFVPDAQHSEGGTFYLTNQHLAADSAEDPSLVFEVEAPLKSSSMPDAAAFITKAFALDVIDLSGLYYHPKRDLLYVLSDTLNSCSVLTRNGSLLQTYDIPGRDQEGITLDANGMLYIAQDSGGILAFSWNEHTFPHLSTK